MTFVVPAGAVPRISMRGVPRKRGVTLPGAVMYFNGFFGAGCGLFSGAWNVPQKLYQSPKIVWKNAFSVEARGELGISPKNIFSSDMMVSSFASM